MTSTWQPPEEGPLLGMKTGRKGDWITTFTGKRWWPHDPRAEEVCLGDQRALCQVIRFGGHCQLSGAFALYSVADHSVRVAELVRALGGTPEEQRCALFHDGHEVYPPGDVLGPVFFYDCPATRALKEMSHAAESAFREALCLPLKMPDVVRHADLVLLATEKRDLMAPVSWEKPLPAPLEERVIPRSPSAAWARFADLAYVLHRVDLAYGPGEKVIPR